MTNKKFEARRYDVVVVGGGMSGVCAAIAAARHGAHTAIIQNRPVFGGNASSEIRMHICGADHHGSRPDARETGILEEILLENRKRNPQHSFSILDTVLWEKVRFQENLDMYLNTHMTNVAAEGSCVKKISAEQLTTETVFDFEANIFIDATGDGTLASLAGAEYMSGREGKDVFGERYAPDQSDHITMGNSLLFKTVDVGYPVAFEKPEWANTYSEEELAYRGHNEFTSGYWWIELGGNNEDVIQDGEVIRDELLKAVYGVWDHIKNSGHHNSENFVLDWVGFLPGKRESRRITGDYILTEHDCFGGKVFEDAVAYGGWPMDMHIVDGLKTRLEPTLFLNVEDVYTIPYRSLYSKNITNLMVGGRAISASHMAFGSTRVMATCAVVGQAVGTAAAMAVEKKLTPRDINSHIREMQRTLIKDDCYIPGFINDDPDDIARNAKVSCSSSIESCEAEKVVNGWSRKIKDESNCWVSDEMSGESEWIELDFCRTVSLREIILRFDSNLSKELMPSLSHSVLSKQIPGIPPQLVKDYTIDLYKDGNIVYSQEFKSNYQRNNIHKLTHEAQCDKMRVKIHATHGDKHARIFEIRVY